MVSMTDRNAGKADFDSFWETGRAMDGKFMREWSSHHRVEIWSRITARPALRNFVQIVCNLQRIAVDDPIKASAKKR